MANIKVSELTTATNFNDEDYAMIVQNGENKKIIKENMIKNDYIRTSPTADVSITASATNTKLTLQKDFCSNDNAFEIYDGGIKCKKSGTIEISTFLHITNITAQDDVGIIIIKNDGSTVNISNFFKIDKNNYHFGSGTNYLQISANDVFYFYIMNATGARGKARSGAITRMLIKYI